MRVSPSLRIALGGLGLACALLPNAQAQLAIRDIAIDFRGDVTLHAPTVKDRYYVLLAGPSAEVIHTPVEIRLGDNQEQSFNARRLPDPDTSFFRILEIANQTPLDSDGDGIDDVWELQHPGILNPLDARDADLDPDGNGQSHRAEYEAATLPLTTVLASSPADYETGVSPTREMVVRFTAPLAPNTTLTTSHLHAESAGRGLLGRVQLSLDRRSATLFHLEPLPGSAQVEVTFDGSDLRDAWNRPLDADGDGQAGGVRKLLFETVGRTASADGVVLGRVFASQLAAAPGPGEPKSINVPLAGVILTADGLEETVRAVTDSFGNFRLTNAPAGEFFVHIDGRPIVDAGAGIRYPDQAYYPYVGKRWAGIAGREVNIGDIYLPLVAARTLVPVSATADTVVSFPSEVVATHPELAGVTLTVPANSLYSDDGRRGGSVGIAPVPPDRLPEPLPEGLSAPLVITVQTDGPSNFDQPVPVCFPNLPDPASGEALAPGAKTGLWSFNHDLGSWEVVGPMTISADGRFACSDPGYGIRQPGWHFPNPGNSGSGGNNGPGPNTPPSPTGKGTTPSGSPSPGLGLTCPPAATAPNTTDPVRMHSGEFYQIETDMEIPGVGLDFRWTRHYRSRVGFVEHGQFTGGSTVAIGNDWDFSYNVYILQEGRQYTLHDGNNRRDLLFETRDNWSDTSGDPFNPSTAEAVWIQNGLPYELTRRLDGTFRILFPDRGAWEFSAPHQRPGWQGAVPFVGRLERIIDRNGNTLRLEYDATEQLARVIDTLGRTISVRCDKGRVVSLTDFAGRTVRYEYFEPGEYGGFPGDLKAVLSPPVVGTPTGNDFPNGKRTSYTYSVYGWAHPLTHNLLTITDGRRNDRNDPTFGQGPYLENEYGIARDQDNRSYVENWIRRFRSGAARGGALAGARAGTATRRLASGGVSEELRLSYDRLVRQRWGRGTIDITYEAYLLNPADAASGAFVLYGEFGLPVIAVPPATLAGQPIPGYGVRTTVRDRVGNVSEYLYDAFGTSRRYTEFTGRSDPTQPVTRTSNRPTGRLRPTDPASFLTEYGEDANANPNLVRHPRGNEESRTYDASGPRFVRNLRSRTQRPVQRAGIPDAAQPELVESFEYDTDHAGCCGFNFVTRHTDARGNVQIDAYDDRGNRTNRIHRIPSITEQWSYNERGQLTRHVNPDNGSGHRRVDVYEYYEDGPSRGFLARYIRDADGLRLTTAYEYDLVGNLTRRLDPNGNDTRYTYNALDQVVRIESPEVAPGVRIRTDYHYDANNNVTRIEVDNLDAEGRPRTNARLTTTYEYNLLNSMVRKSEEIDEGNLAVTEYDYDANENLVEIRYPECVAGRQPSNRVRFLYDERNLLFREIRAPGAPEESVTQYDYDANGNLVRTTEALGTAAPRITQRDYDGYNRLRTETDAMGNVTTWDYDANDNPVSVRIDGELEDVPGSAGNVRLAESTYQHDALNRLERIQTALFDPATQEPVSGGTAVTLYEYNGLSQLTRQVNANQHETRIAYDTADRRQRVTDALGNTVEYGYDAAGNFTRLTETEKPDLGGPDEVFVTEFGYDALHRRTESRDNIGTVRRHAYDSRHCRVRDIDGRGNRIEYDYDGLDRLVETRHLLTDTGDGSGTVIDTITTRQAWDDSGRLVSQTDDNGNSTSYRYDGLGRLFATVMADGTGVTNRFDALGNPVITDDANGTRLVSEYDALGRIARRDVTPGPGVSPATTFETYRYDGLGQLIRAEDDDAVVGLAYDSGGRVRRDTQNGRTVTSTYDPLGNRTTVTYPSGRQITQTFDALERLATITDPEGLAGRYAYVGPRRVARRDTRDALRLSYRYDGLTAVPNPAGDRGVRRVIGMTHARIAGGEVLDDRAYAWDASGNKTVHSELLAGGDQRTLGYDSAHRLVHSRRVPALGAAEEIEYRFDGVGNRTEVLGGPDAGTYDMSAGPAEPADRPVNQYTRTPFDTREYDRNGNLTARRLVSGQVLQAEYDAWNQLAVSRDPDTGVAVAFSYDPLGRRIRKTQTGPNAGVIDYTHLDVEVIEESGPGAGETTSHVLGARLDEVILSHEAGGDRLYLQDDQGTVRAFVAPGSPTLHRPAYRDYGPAIADPALGDARARSFTYTGRDLEPESGLLGYRSRFLDPRSGTFATRDLAGTWYDRMNVGNDRLYVGANPWSYIDPFGARHQAHDCDGPPNPRPPTPPFPPPQPPLPLGPDDSGGRSPGSQPPTIPGDPGSNPNGNPNSPHSPSPADPSSSKEEKFGGKRPTPKPPPELPPEVEEKYRRKEEALRKAYGKKYESVILPASFRDRPDPEPGSFTDYLRGKHPDIHEKANRYDPTREMYGKVRATIPKLDSRYRIRNHGVNSSIASGVRG